MALDIDYAGLWRRARRTALSGRTMTTLSAEDELLVLAIDSGKDRWQRVEAASGVSAFIGSHPNLDWPPSSIVPDRNDAFAWSCWQPHWHGSISERPYPMGLFPRNATTQR
jgi:hypothetical protein